MDDLTDLEHIRKRPAMYIGDTVERGLDQLFNELLDNSIDQFLAGHATSVYAATTGSTLEFSDDGPGLPFDEPCPDSGCLATKYLTVIRLDSPTADGHSPHIHLGGWGCGLRLVTGLTKTCDVESWRNGALWRQSFTKGIQDGPAEVVSQPVNRGTVFRLSVDRDVFSVEWCQQRIQQRLMDAAYLFPGLRVAVPGFQFVAPRGIADLAKKVAGSLGGSEVENVWWFNESTDDFLLQAAVAGTTDGDTQWHAFANGCTSIENGTHLTALKRVVDECAMKPAAAFIHVVMRRPRFAGPTRSKLDVPEILSPMCEAMKPSLQEFISAN